MDLQMTVKVVNDSVWPDTVVPTLLIFETLSRLSLPADTLSSSTIQRAIVLRKAMAEVWKTFASRQFCDALKSLNGPGISDSHTRPIVAPVLVYRLDQDH